MPDSVRKDALGGKSPPSSQEVPCRRRAALRKSITLFDPCRKKKQN